MNFEELLNLLVERIKINKTKHFLLFLVFIFGVSILLFQLVRFFHYQYEISYLLLIPFSLILLVVLILGHVNKYGFFLSVNESSLLDELNYKFSLKERPQAIAEVKGEKYHYIEKQILDDLTEEELKEITVFSFSFFEKIIFFLLPLMLALSWFLYGVLEKEHLVAKEEIVNIKKIMKNSFDFSEDFKQDLEKLVSNLEDLSIQSSEFKSHLENLDKKIEEEKLRKENRGQKKEEKKEGKGKGEEDKKKEGEKEQKAGKEKGDKEKKNQKNKKGQDVDNIKKEINKIRKKMNNQSKKEKEKKKQNKGSKKRQGKKAGDSKLKEKQLSKKEGEILKEKKYQEVKIKEEFKEIKDPISTGDLFLGKGEGGEDYKLEEKEIELHQPEDLLQEPKQIIPPEYQETIQ